VAAFPARCFTRLVFLAEDPFLDALPTRNECRRDPRSVTRRSIWRTIVSMWLVSVSARLWSRYTSWISLTRNRQAPCPRGPEGYHGDWAIRP